MYSLPDAVEHLFGTAARSDIPGNSRREFQLSIRPEHLDGHLVPHAFVFGAAHNTDDGDVRLCPRVDAHPDLVPDRIDRPEVLLCESIIHNAHLCTIKGVID